MWSERNRGRKRENKNQHKVDIMANRKYVIHLSVGVRDTGRRGQR